MAVESCGRRRCLCRRESGERFEQLRGELAQLAVRRWRRRTHSVRPENAAVGGVGDEGAEDDGLSARGDAVARDGRLLQVDEEDEARGVGMKVGDSPGERGRGAAGGDGAGEFAGRFAVLSAGQRGLAAAHIIAALPHLLAQGNRDGGGVGLVGGAGGFCRVGGCFDVDLNQPGAGSVRGLFRRRFGGAAGRVRSRRAGAVSAASEWQETEEDNDPQGRSHGAGVVCCRLNRVFCVATGKSAARGWRPAQRLGHRPARDAHRRPFRYP